MSTKITKELYEKAELKYDKSFLELLAECKRMKDETAMLQMYISSLKDSPEDDWDFPRGDIDEYTVEYAKAAWNKLKNDLRELVNRSEAIEKEYSDTLSSIPQLTKFLNAED